MLMCVCVRLLIFSETHIMRPRDEIEIRYYNNAFYANDLLSQFAYGNFHII
jgi:hypothetical protein